MILETLAASAIQLSKPKMVSNTNLSPKIVQLGVNPEDEQFYQKTLLEVFPELKSQEPEFNITDTKDYVMYGQRVVIQSHVIAFETTKNNQKIIKVGFQMKMTNPKRTNKPAVFQGFGYRIPVGTFIPSNLQLHASRQLTKDAEKTLMSYLATKGIKQPSK
jgi:hypothetical protein